MTEYSSRLAGDIPSKSPIARFKPVVFVITPLVAILFQVYVARFLEYLAYLDLPLLVTVYFTLMRRAPIFGLFFGSGIGYSAGNERSRGLLVRTTGRHAPGRPMK